MKKEKQTGVCYSRHVMIMIPLCDLLILFLGHMVSVSVPVHLRSNCLRSKKSTIDFTDQVRIMTTFKFVLF